MRVASYSTLPWHDVFAGSIGAAAALTGLLFVAISINLEQILKYPMLPGRAAGTLGVLVSALIVSGLALLPGLSHRILGAEITAIGVIAVVQAVWVSRERTAEGGRSRWHAEHLATLSISSIAMIVGGVSLVALRGGGLYWVSAGILLAFVLASINAWVLLVEIKR